MVQKVPAEMLMLPVPMLVGDLPAPAIELQGARSFVIDTTSIVFGEIVVGGGANIVPVYCDGVDWRVG